ncbi:hypothetical protein HN014_17740 [Aquimarina sp. TRL1]|uniref:retroviral-like aspartic protease family protein n=1 Tax=Aquimarina sp. (strain TRL1) TaxID=2736252 RepID=UPI00158D16B7|nr:retroviral-like aspartic protease family protein [Aquimarina sp. TRL1]QKX06679.1 hypothetical protein HN014_17740 [Aquimarina sp. TRL1]
MKKTISFLFVLLFLSGCTALKKLKIITQGRVTNTNYLDEIPFDYYRNLIFIKVKINNRAYNFLLDTGWDLTAISPEILNDISLQNTGITNITEDAANKTEDFEYLLLDTISIGNVNFKEIAVYAKDFSHFQKTLGCIRLDGVIGNNLMRHAKWQIDYKKQIIKITDDISKIISDTSLINIPLKTGNYGGADIEITLNGIKKEFTFDTGFNSKLQSDHKTFKKLKLSDKHYTVKKGITGVQANGETTGTSYISLIKNVNLPNLALNDQLVVFEKNQSSLLGNGFLKNYLVTIDWSDKQLYLNPIKEIQSDTLRTYQYVFAPDYEKNKIVFYNEYTELESFLKFKKSIEILKINEMDVQNLSNTELCKLWKKVIKVLKKNINLVVRDNGIEKNITLSLKQLLPKEQ